MAQILANREMLVAGRKYKAGEAIPVDKLPPGRLRQLLDQRRVVEDRVQVSRGPGRPRKER